MSRSSRSMMWVAAALVWVTILMPAALEAQDPLDQLPGFFPTEYLDLVAAEDVAVEINLQGSMLKMVAAFAGQDDPEFALLVGSLDAIRVRSGEFAPGRAAAIGQRLKDAQSWLSSNGWLPMVRVREEGEEIYVYSREDQGDIVGFTILAIEGGEATAVNLVGRIDPAKLVQVIDGFNLDVLDELELGALGPDP